MTTYLLLGQWTGALMVVAWQTAAGLLYLAKRFGNDPPDLLRSVFHELRPFYLPALIGSYLAGTATDGIRLINLFALGMGLLSWWLYKDIDDDDRWKRRREKLLERVQVAGGRLTVVPAGAS